MLDKYKHDNVTIYPLITPRDAFKIPPASLDHVYLEIAEYHKPQEISFYFENDCFLYIYAGTCSITLDDRTIRAGAGDGVILRGKRTWKYEFEDAGCRMFSVNFGGTITDELLIGYGLREGGHYPDCGCLGYCNILETAARQESITFHEIENEVLRFLLLVFQQLSEYEIDEDISLAAKAKRFVMRRLFFPTLSVSRLAKDLQCSAPKLERCFRSAYGLTIRQFVIEQRLKKAKELLISSSLSVSEIASSVGYASRKYLDHLFLKYDGMTAISYRNQHGSAKKD